MKSFLCESGRNQRRPALRSIGRGFSPLVTTKRFVTFSLMTAIATGSLAMGCSRAPESSDSSPTATGGAKISWAVENRTGQIILPLDSYLPTYRQSHEIDYAWQLLDRDCLARIGVTFPLVDRRSENPPVSRRYGVWAPSEVYRYAYSVPPDPPGARRQEELNRRAVPRREQEQLARCRRERPEYRQLSLSNLESQLVGRDVYHATIRGERGVALLQEWRTCLRRQGVDPLPGDEHVFQPLGDVATVTPRSISAAEVDVACKSEVALVERMAALEAEAQTAVIADKRAALDQQRAAVTRAVEVARQVVRSPGG